MNIYIGISSSITFRLWAENLLCVFYRCRAAYIILSTRLFLFYIHGEDKVVLSFKEYHFLFYKDTLPFSFQVASLYLIHKSKYGQN